MNDEDKHEMDRAASESGLFVGLEPVAFRDGFKAALAHRDKRVAELEGELVDAQVFAHYEKETSDKLQTALTALREAVIDATCDAYEKLSQQEVDLAEKTTGDTDHANS